MPKLSNLKSASIKKWIEPFNKDFEVFTTNGKTVTCMVCLKDIVCNKKNNVESHSLSGKYFLNFTTFYLRFKFQYSI